jgi:alkylation response protein AidB-like acyl-CoA dehydrogenase
VYPTQLDLDADQILFTQTCQQFLEKEYPLPRVRAGIETAGGLDRSLWKREAELGWFGLLSPADLGGGGVAGNGVADSASVAAQLGRFLHPGPVLPTNVIAGAVARAGSPQQCATLVPRLIEGTAVATWALGEPGWLWGDGEPSFRVRVAEDGGVVVSGAARYVQDATAADYLLVSGRRVGDGHDQATIQVLVPTGAPGVTVVPLRSLDLTRGLADVRLADVALPSTSVVGDVEPTAARVAHQFDLAVLLQSAETVGAAERVFEFTLQYARDRIAFGRPIGSYQAIKHRLADLLVWLEGAKATVAAAIGVLEADSDDGSHLVSVAAAYVKDIGPRLIQECVQLHGGIGLTWEHDIHLYLRRATTNGALLGTAATHRGRLDALLTSLPRVESAVTTPTL